MHWYEAFPGLKGDFYVHDTGDYSRAAVVGWRRWLLRILEMGDGRRHRDLRAGLDNCGHLLLGRRAQSIGDTWSKGKLNWSRGVTAS